MYKYKKPTQTTLKVNKQYKGESIEEKIHRIVNNKEPIKDGAPLIYTDRQEGTRPEYDIRTDRWEVAVEAMDVVTKAELAKRAERAEANKKAGTETKDSGTTTTMDGGAEPIRGTT